MEECFIGRVGQVGRVGEGDDLDNTRRRFWGTKKGPPRGGPTDPSLHVGEASAPNDWGIMGILPPHLTTPCGSDKSIQVQPYRVLGWGALSDNSERRVEGTKKDLGGEVLFDG